MEFTDEAILQMQKQMEEREKERHSEKVIEEELKHSIYDEIKIFHIPVRFLEMELLDGRITMRLPKDFTPRTKEEIERVYVLGNQPQHVYSNSYLDFALALNWTSHEVTQENLFEAAKTVEYMIDRIGPKSRFIGKEKLEREEGNLVIYKILANAIDGVNYMNMFCASVENRLLLGNLSFDQKFSKRLAPLTDEIVKSLRVRREK
ncbi:MAG: hypothetical protein ACI4AQ_06960 [Lachnospiraceae bacterium]